MVSRPCVPAKYYIGGSGPKGRCTKFGLFQGKFRGLKTCLILGWYKFKGFKISKFNQIFDKVRLELGPAH